MVVVEVAALDRGAPGIFDLVEQVWGMKNIVWLLLVVSFVAAPSLAEDSRDTEKASTKLALKDALPGTWNYVSSSPTKDGVFTSIEPTKMFWTFNGDGSGLSYRKINEFNAARIHDELRWSVQGNTLTMDGDIHYTIVDWDESRMTWLNPSKTTYIRVEKQK